MTTPPRQSLHSVCRRQDANFRPVRLRLGAEAAGAALLLCADRGGSFGAPDVAEVALDRITLDAAVDRRFSDRPPDQVPPRAWCRLRGRCYLPACIDCERSWPARAWCCCRPTSMRSRVSSAGLFQVVRLRDKGSSRAARCL